MGMVKSLTNLAETGLLTITGDPGWYIVTYADSVENLYIRVEHPTLQGAIASVESQLRHYWMRSNMDNTELWNRIRG